MSYIDDNLLPDEHVVYRSQLHWIIFARPILWFILGIIFYYVSFHVYFPFPLIKIVIAIPFIIGIVELISMLMRYMTTEFGVTNKRIIMKIGFIRRYSSENFLQRVENIQVEQSIPGRILGYGTVIIIGTGGTHEPFNLVSDPLDFRKQVQIQVERAIGNDRDDNSGK